MNRNNINQKVFNLIENNRWGSVEEEQAEPEGGVKQAISLESLCSYKLSKSNPSWILLPFNIDIKLLREVSLGSGVINLLSQPGHRCYRDT